MDCDDRNRMLREKRHDERHKVACPHCNAAIDLLFRVNVYSEPIMQPCCSECSKDFYIERATGKTCVEVDPNEMFFQSIASVCRMSYSEGSEDLYSDADDGEFVYFDEYEEGIKERDARISNMIHRNEIANILKEGRCFMCGGGYDNKPFEVGWYSIPVCKDCVPVLNKAYADTYKLTIEVE